MNPAFYRERRRRRRREGIAPSATTHSPSRASPISPKNRPRGTGSRGSVLHAADAIVRTPPSRAARAIERANPNAHSVTWHLAAPAASGIVQHGVFSDDPGHLSPSLGR